MIFMGGISVMTQVEEFTEKHGDEIKLQYEELLIGKTIVTFKLLWTTMSTVTSL